MGATRWLCATLSRGLELAETKKVGRLFVTVPLLLLSARRRRRACEGERRRGSIAR
jgi:hypothetical protein